MMYRKKIEVVPGLMDINELRAVAKRNAEEWDKNDKGGTFEAVSYYEDQNPYVCVASAPFEFQDGSIAFFHHGIDKFGESYCGMCLSLSGYGIEWGCEKMVHPYFHPPLYSYFDQGRKHWAQMFKKASQEEYELFLKKYPRSTEVTKGETSSGDEVTIYYDTTLAPAKETLSTIASEIFYPKTGKYGYLIRIDLEV